jgi:hypothetical protein
MNLRLMGAIGVATLLLAIHPTMASAQGAGPSKNEEIKKRSRVLAKRIDEIKGVGAPQKAETKKQSKALAERIDKIIYQRLAQEKRKPGPKVGLAQAVRRLCIDLSGKIPNLLETRDLLDPTNDSPTKWEDRVDALLANPDYAVNFSHYWRSVMLVGNNDEQLRLGLQFQFDGWLRKRLADNTGYDKMAFEVLISAAYHGVAKSLTYQPDAFFGVNENKAENLAAATARVFLGTTLECAQCHQHPYAKWTTQQFWEYAAFFSGVAPRKMPGKPQPFNPDSKEIRIPGTDIVAKAKYPNGEVPNWGKYKVRGTLADWVTTPNNPYFARAAVDHVWQYFFGVSLMQPIFEPIGDGAPAHPELLDELARAFADSGFDLKFLIRSMVLTDAYVRGSVPVSEQNKADIQLFAKIPIRGMMPEQLFASYCLAGDIRNLGYDEVNPLFGPPPKTLRVQFLASFYEHDRRIASPATVVQALKVMDGKLLNDCSNLDRHVSLKTIATAKTTTARRVETLYLVALSRLPTVDETKKWVDYIDKGGDTGDPQQAVAEFYKMLLLGPEFMLIH